MKLTKCTNFNDKETSDMYQFSLWLLFSILINQSVVAGTLPMNMDGQPLPSLAPMLDKATPAVVNISTKTRTRVESPLLSDPFFRHFFNIPEQSEQRYEQSLGSGVIVDAKKGYVITNNHVIDKADEITVTLRDGRKSNAKLVGKDRETDIALIKILLDNLSELPLANSDKLRVGDFVVAIGNPFGLGQTVTSGIVSALGRSGLGIEGYEDFIQTDASINPGNSGGALVNLRGELVGINTAIIAPGGGNVGIGFAIPINMVHQVTQHLVEHGAVQRGVLGIELQDLTPDLAIAFGLDSTVKGAVVASVNRNSAAEKADIRASDVIVAINDQLVDNTSDVRNRIGLLRVGDEVKITVMRKNTQLNLTATVAAGAGKISGIDGGKLTKHLSGVTLSDVQGVIEIVNVDKRSMAWRGGLRSR
ncbi:MAG: Do family serine endopeptidase [Thiotrichaceae bacterium]